MRQNRRLANHGASVSRSSIEMASCLIRSKPSSIAWNSISAFIAIFGAPAAVDSSQRNIPMLLWRVGVAFVLEQGEGADEFGSGLRGLDHFIDEAAFGGDVRV